MKELDIAFQELTSWKHETTARTDTDSETDRTESRTGTDDFVIAWENKMCDDRMVRPDVERFTDRVCRAVRGSRPRGRGVQAVTPQAGCITNYDLLSKGDTD